MEIKPQELRIGNLVYAPALKAIREIDPLDIRDLHEGRLYQPFQGIELTPEWLARLGYRYYNGHCAGDMTMDFGGKMDVDLFCGHIQIKSHYESYDLYRFLTHIRYVHQIQNLFYALTGEELAIDKTSLI